MCLSVFWGKLSVVVTHVQKKKMLFQTLYTNSSEVFFYFSLALILFSSHLSLSLRTTFSIHVLHVIVVLALSVAAVGVCVVQGGLGQGNDGGADRDNAGSMALLMSVKLDDFFVIFLSSLV